MGKLVLYGDSFTAGHHLSHSFLRTRDWIEYLGGKLPLNWYEILSEKLGIGYINHAQGGSSNDYIFETFCKTCHLINQGDIVIFQWTYNDRFRWAKQITTPSGNILNIWKNLSVSFTKETASQVVNVSTWEDILINRTSQLYVDLYSNYQKFIEHFAEVKKFDLYIWAADTDNIYNQPLKFLKQKKYICHDLIVPKLDMLKKMPNRSPLLNLIIYMGGKLIIDETDGKVLDGTHLGEVGHRIQAEIFYNYITNFKQPLI